MKTLAFALTSAAVLTVWSLPAAAMPTADAGLYDAAMIGDAIDKKGRRPRVPGGSGCDDPGDILEHPECRV